MPATSIRPKLVLGVPLSAALAGFLGTVPPAAADPTSESADAVMAHLTDQGYDVQINWVGGKSSMPLTECRVTGIHNPDRSAPPADRSLTTVYVDVSCPNEPDDSGVIFGPFGIFG